MFHHKIQMKESKDVNTALLQIDYKLCLGSNIVLIWGEKKTVLN